MAVPEKGLAGTRAAAVAGTRVVKVVGAGGTTRDGMGIVVGTVSDTVSGCVTRATAAGAVFSVGGTAGTEFLIGTTTKSVTAAGIMDEGEDGGEFNADGGGG
jgi:hypothetical protein